jgi:2-dehydropantoate 2-reductase
MTRICIVGVGAIGGCMAGALSPLPDVTLTAVARGATLDSLRRRGLTIAGSGGTVQHVELEATSQPAKLGRQDMLIIATKGQALPKVAPALAPLVGPDTVIVPLLNGVPWWYFAHLDGPAAGLQLDSVDPDGIVTKHLPPAQVVGAVVHFSASSPLPATVSRGNGNQLIVGDPTGRAPDAVARVRALMAAGGFDVELSAEIHREVWYKLWGNLCLNPISALTRATVDAIVADPQTRELCTRIMAEAAAVSERFGIRIDASADDRIAVAGKLGRFKTSMLHDAESGRRLELAPLLGAVCEIAAHLDVPVPYTRMVLGLARLLDQSLLKRP